MFQTSGFFSIVSPKAVVGIHDYQLCDANLDRKRALTSPPRVTSDRSCTWTAKDLGIGDKTKDEDTSRWTKPFWNNALLRAQKSNVTCLHLDYALRTLNFDDIRDLFTFACNLQHLEELYLKSNKLTAAHFEKMPFGRMPRLRKVVIANNALTQWPRNFLRFNFALEYLNFSDNLLSSVPAFLLLLQNLRDVRMEGNHCFNWVTQMHLPFTRRIEWVGPVSDQDSLNSLEVLSFLSLLKSGSRAIEVVADSVFYCVGKDLTNLLLCDFCCYPIPSSQKYLLVFLFPPSMFGRTYVMVAANACSEKCAGELFSKWDWKVVEKEIPPSESRVYYTSNYELDHNSNAGCCKVM